jgi:hypothetical protein
VTSIIIFLSEKTAHPIPSKTLLASHRDTQTTMADHKKTALLVLLRCHHNNGQELTYSELSAEMGVGEKTKAWQCEAWKDLRSNDHVVKGSEPKTWKLSDEGIKLATSLCSDEELKDYQQAMTNDEHHGKIKSKLERNAKDKANKGAELFDFLISMNCPLTKDEVAGQFNTVPDAHGFFYGWQGMML